jgi:hypothetical protein
MLTRRAWIIGSAFLAALAFGTAAQKAEARHPYGYSRSYPSYSYRYNHYPRYRYYPRYQYYPRYRYYQPPRYVYPHYPHYSPNRGWGFGFYYNDW